MSLYTLVPSAFSSPFVTTITMPRFEENGRQKSFTETQVQRMEREAFAAASKSRGSSPALSPLSSGSSSPKFRKLIEQPIDPIELMANRLAEELELFSLDDFSSSEDEESTYIPKPSAPKSVSFKPGHRRKRTSLSSIPEED